MNQYDHFELDREAAVRELTAQRNALHVAASRRVPRQVRLPSSLELARAKEREAEAAAREPGREA